MDNSEKEFLEMPFGPPPILPDIKTELKEYVVYPEKLPIHQLDKVQQYWERERNILSLLKADLSPMGTTLRYDRDPIIGCIGDIKEVDLQSVGETVRNSMSMSRAPGPVAEGVKGNASNFLFWPGGFEEPEKSNLDGVVEVDFENNLKVLAKGFKSGIEFMPDNCTPKSLANSKKINKKSKKVDDKKEENINLSSVIDSEGSSLAFWSNDNKNDEDKNNVNRTANNNVEIPNIDEFIEPIAEKEIPVLKISELPRTNLKTSWAEQIDIMIPVTDFNQKIPEPAMTFPYELDNFQKQAIIKLEEGNDVFVAAHTSAGKTTIAEYAIALSQKHMTRTIYTSPIKALSNQKFREFKEKFENVGLITGDLQINSTAMCLIMTTEILQSILYCAAEIIRDVEYVVFDEVHYINNEDRGHVWEEVIILLPPTVTIVMLSATVPNPLEFAHWVGQIKRRKMYVISTIKRPVPLQHYLYTGYDRQTKDQIFLLVDKDGNFFRNSVIEAETAKEKAQQKQSKMNKMKYQQGKHKPSLVLKPTTTAVYKNASVEEAVNTATVSKEEEEAYEDKVRSNMMATKEKKMWLALLEYLQANDSLPVVVFTLSRNRCDKTVDSFTESLLTPDKQAYVKEFFKKSIKHLKGTDSQLPQVLKMQRLLKLGIGVHHSGILPILKEIVEMLFQKGIVKVLFATETFAMGVNMPAKTVVFDSVEKFDGVSHRNLLPTEYIQMAGRSGRRGHDETGTVIILCKRKVPKEKDLRDITLGAPQNLISKFKVTYPMVLHLKRLSEAISIGEMMRRSFKEARTMSNQAKNKDELEKIMQLMEQIKPLEKHQYDLVTFYDMAWVYLDLWKCLRPYFLETKKAVKALVEGRVLLISYQHHVNKLAIFLGTQKKTKEILYKVFVVSTVKEEEEAKTNKKEDSWYELMALMNTRFYRPEGDLTHEILFIPAMSIIEITNCIANVNCKNIWADWERRQIPRFRDSPPGPSCQKAAEDLSQLIEAIFNNSDVIYPYVELKLNKVDLITKEIQLSNAGMSLMTVKDKIINTPNFEEEFDQVFKHKELEKKKLELSKKLSDEYLGNYPEYESRVKVLKELNYIDHEDRVTLKGRVALEMGTYEIFLTELILDNVLTNWQPEEIAAMLSALVFPSKKSKDEEEEVKEEIPRLNELKKEMTAVYNRLIEVEKTHGLDPIPRPNFHLIQVVYEWARAKSFAKIMELTDIQEGIIVRCIQQLNETLQDVRNASIIIGQPALKEKMEEASTKIKRDIVFTASLYTQD